MIFRYTLGADPEFLVRRISDKSVVPIVGLLGGTKDAPIPFNQHVAIINYYGGTGAVLSDYKFQEDGVVAEVNIPACADGGSFARAIHTVRERLSLILKTAAEPLEVVTDFCSYRFSNEQLSSPQAQRLGCDPDMVAYNDSGAPAAMARPPFKASDLGNYRHAGGHVHVGFDKDLVPDHVVVNLMDAFVYLPLLPRDVQTMRRPFYGKAGLYRPKEYGVEYRTMSNFWTTPGVVCQNTGYTMANVVGYYVVNLMHDLHTRTEVLAQLYRRIPWPSVRAIIDKGVSDEESKREWMSLMKCLQGLGAYTARREGFGLAVFSGMTAQQFAWLDGSFWMTHRLYNDTKAAEAA